MTRHRHTSVSPELGDAAPPALDPVLIHDGKYFHLDFEGVDVAFAQTGPEPSPPAGRDRSGFVGRSGGLVIGLFTVLVIGGAITALVMTFDVRPDFEFGSFFLSSGPAETIPKPAAIAASAIPSDLSPWAAEARKATPTCPGPVCEDERKSRLAEIRQIPPIDAVGSLNKVREQLQVVESQRNGCEVALSLMKDAKSVFSGFVPELSDTGLASHKVFQARIAELELKRKSLLARFTPKSREVRTVDEEIAAVRESFKECLSAYIAYLDQRKAYLMARRAELERAPEAVARKRTWPIPGPSAGDAINAPPRIVPDAASPRSEKPFDTPKSPSASRNDGDIEAIRPAAFPPVSRAVSTPVEKAAEAPQSWRQRAAGLFPSATSEESFTGFAWKWVSAAVWSLWEEVEQAGTSLVRADATAPHSSNQSQPSDVTPW